MGLMPSIWGNFYWNFIHMSSLNFENHLIELDHLLKQKINEISNNSENSTEIKEQQTKEITNVVNENKQTFITHYKNFFQALSSLLLCPGCSVHCYDYITKNPPPLNTDQPIDTLFNYTIDFHNSVNKRLNKLELTYAEAKKHIYEKFLNPKEQLEIKRAQEIRLEDHKKIKEIMDKMHESSEGQTTNQLQITFIIILLVILVLLFLIF